MVLVVELRNKREELLRDFVLVKPKVMIDAAEYDNKADEVFL